MDGRIVSVQLMRALACLLVLLVHINTFNPLTANLFAGSIGVDIFFVISGYIIAKSIERLSAKSPSKTFLINRFSRVAPYYYLITALWVLLNFAVFHAVPPGQVMLKSFLFFPTQADPAQPVGWSLNFEVYFWLCLGALLLFTRNVKYLAFSFLLLIIALQLVPSNRVPLREVRASLNLEFVFGMLIYTYQNKLLPFFRSLAWFGLATVLLLLVMTICVEWPSTAAMKAHTPPFAFYRDTVYFWQYPLTLPRGLAFGLPAAFLFLVTIAQEPRLAHFKDSNLLLRIGNASFTLYLIQHFFFFPLGIFKISNLLLLLGACLIIIAVSLRVFVAEGYIAKGAKRLLNALT